MATGYAVARQRQRSFATVAYFGTRQAPRSLLLFAVEHHRNCPTTPACDASDTLAAPSVIRADRSQGDGGNITTKENHMHTNLVAGKNVVTSDGEKLGTVKEVRGDFFKVDAPMMKDYWVACDTVANELGDTVRLSFTKDNVEAYRQPEPAKV